ncbi:MAG: serine/threonine protein kinase [Candidatus Obscuribacterales bacterium]|nr:serine/threonine protein kinase [Candidatus Obscuribacterales bacterium]
MRQIDSSLVGTTVDRCFLVTQFIGMGGMGSAFRATQLELNREVCLKFLKLDSVTSLEGLERFKREARVLAKLRHKNIVSCYSFGLFENFCPYLAMEFIDGVSLKMLSTDQELGWSRACRLVIQVCDALDYAHRNNFVHRDIKPENLMILQLANEEIVKVVDFGLVGKCLGAEGSFDTLTSPGSMLGTVNYMAPEAFRGVDVDQTVDIYALGCVLYELLSAELPFEADSPIAVMYKHNNERLAELPQNVGPASVRRRLEEVIWTATAKTKEDRFSTCGEMAGVLSDLLNQSAETSADKSLSSPVVSSVRLMFQRRGAKICVAFGLLGLMVLSLIFVSQLKRAAPPHPWVPPGKMTENAEQLFSVERPSSEDVERTRKRLALFEKEAATLAAKWSGPIVTSEREIDLPTSQFADSFSIFLHKESYVLNAEDPATQNSVRSISRSLSLLTSSLVPKDRRLLDALLVVHSDLLSCLGFLDASAMIIETGKPLPVDLVLTPADLSGSKRFYDKSLSKVIKNCGVVDNNEAVATGLLRLRPAIPYYLRLAGNGAAVDGYVSVASGWLSQDDWHPSIGQVVAGYLKRNSKATLPMVIDLAVFESRLGNKAIALNLLKWLESDFYRPGELSASSETFAMQLGAAGDSAAALSLLRHLKTMAYRRRDDWKWCQYGTAIVELYSSDLMFDQAERELVSVLKSPQWKNIQCDSSNSRKTQLVDLLTRMGSQWLRCKRYSEAEKYLRLAVQMSEISRANQACERELVRCLLFAGRSREADSFVEGRIARYGRLAKNERRERLLLLSRLYAEQGLFEKALNLQAHAQADDLKSIKFEKGSWLESAGKLDSALAIYRQIYADQSSSVALRQAALMRASGVSATRGLEDDCRRVSMKLIDSILPPLSSFHEADYEMLWTGLVHLTISSFSSEAIAECENLLREKQRFIADDVRIGSLLENAIGDLEWNRGNLTKAKGCFSKFCENLAKDNKCRHSVFWGRMKLSELNKYQGNFVECNRILQELSQETSEYTPVDAAREYHCIVLKARADLASRSLRFSEAAKLLESAVSLHPPAHKVGLLYTKVELAHAYAASGQTAKAKVLLRTIQPKDNSQRSATNRLLEHVLCEYARGLALSAVSSEEGTVHLRNAMESTKLLPINSVLPEQVLWASEQLALNAQRENESARAIAYLNDGLRLLDEKMVALSMRRPRSEAKSRLLADQSSIYERTGKLADAETAIRNAILDAPPADKEIYRQQLAAILRKQGMKLSPSQRSVGKI